MNLPRFRLHVRGDYACFTRPEMKVERVSYDVITPSAARGILESILWKPEMRWNVRRIEVLRPIRFVSVRRNEVGARASLPTTLQMAGRDAPAVLDAVANRQQRSSLLLCDVAYVIEADIGLTARAGPGDSVAKYRDMFQRRAERGQCVKQPYLGCREFFADATLADADTPEPINDFTRDLGWMLHDIVWNGRQASPRFFRADMIGGVIDVPPLDGQDVLG